MNEAINEHFLHEAIDDLKNVPSNDHGMALLREKLAGAFERIEMLVKNNLQLRQQLAQANRYAAESLSYAYRDDLTGLPNRRLLRDRLGQALVQCERHRKQAAVLIIDLDGFKQVNDTKGHTAGDHMLKEVAVRLRANIRSSDTACRYGGDEFVVLLPEVDGEEAVELVVAKIRSSLQEDYVIQGHHLTVGASIGYSLYPQHGSNYHDLIDHADTEMYRAKQSRACR